MREALLRFDRDVADLDAHALGRLEEEILAATMAQSGVIVEVLDVLEVCWEVSQVLLRLRFACPLSSRGGSRQRAQAAADGAYGRVFELGYSRLAMDPALAHSSGRTRAGLLELDALANAAVGKERSRMIANTVRTMLRVRGLMGGADRKSRDEPGTEIADDAKRRKYVEYVRSLWRAKSGNILEELCANIKYHAAPVGGGPDVAGAQQLDWAAVLAFCAELAKELGARSEFLAQTSPLALLCMVLYTQQEVDIDRLMLFPDVPAFPEKAEDRTPEGRDRWYARYRERPGARNPMMFADANWATRACADSSSDSRAKDTHAIFSRKKKNNKRTPLPNS